MRRILLLLVASLFFMAESPAVAAQFTITVSANAGGAVTPNTGKILVAEGGSLSIGFTANAGYYLAGVTIDKVPATLTDPKTFTKDFIDVRQNHTIAAKFALDPVITPSVTAGGTIDPPGKTSVPYGTDKTFTIQPLEGFHLSKVSVDNKDVGIQESVTFEKVTTKHQLKASFTINSYSVTTDIVPVPGAANPGTITPAVLTMKHGQTKTFAIKPAAGMKIAAVAVNDLPVSSLPVSGPLNLPVTATQDVTIRVTFSEIIPAGGQKLQGSYNLVFSEESLHVDSFGGNTNVVENTGGNTAVATFDGNGKCTLSFKGTNFSRQMDQSGNQTVNVKTKTGTIKDCTYVIGAENDLTIILTPDGTETKHGWVSSDGNVFVVGGPRQLSEDGAMNYDVELFTGVKAGSGMTKASVAGAYHLISQETGFWKSAAGGYTFVTDNIRAATVRATFDGKGGCTVNQTGRNYAFQDDGSVRSDPKGFSSSGCTYSLSSTGAMAIKVVTQDGSFTINGWASADGNTFITGQAYQNSNANGVGYDVEHNVGVRESVDMSSSFVSGTYKFVERNPEFRGFVGGSISGSKITATLDGNGGCSIHSEGESNSLFGTTFTNQPKVRDSSACSYTLGPDGALTMNVTVQDTQIVTGWVSADGNIVVIGGPQESVDGTEYGSELAVGVKCSSLP